MEASCNIRGPVAGLLLATSFGWGIWILSGWATFTPISDFDAPVGMGSNVTDTGIYGRTSYHPNWVVISMVAALFFAGILTLITYWKSDDRPFVVRHNIGEDGLYGIALMVVAFAGSIVSFGMEGLRSDNGQPAWYQTNMSIGLWAVCLEAFLCVQFFKYEMHKMRAQQENEAIV